MNEKFKYSLMKTKTSLGKEIVVVANSESVFEIIFQYPFMNEDGTPDTETLSATATAGEIDDLIAMLKATREAVYGAV